MHNPFKNLSKPDFPVLYKDCLQSTNDYAKQILAENPQKSPFALLCGNQIGGKGRRGNSWISEPYKNLTFSIGISPIPIPPDCQFQITMASSLCLISFLQRFLDPQPLKIKWPNDILFGDKKIAGILTEISIEGNTISDAVIGMGINVNQQNFNMLSATSLKLITNLEFDLPEIFEWLIDDFKSSISMLGKPKKLTAAYFENLSWKGEEVTFKMNGIQKIGVLKSLDEQGRIGIEVDGQLVFFQEFELKDLRKKFE